MVFSSGVQTCVIDGCDAKAICRGMCRKHYDRWRYSGSPVKPVRARVCIACGRVFELQSGAKKFCSDTCRKRFKRNSERSRYKVDASPNPLISSEKPRRRVERSGMVAEQFTEADVWARCDGVCFGCGRPVSRDVMSAQAGTPAWIVPPEDGGELSLANRAIFHYGCIPRHADGASDRTARHGRKDGRRNGGKRKKVVKRQA